jgi:hypothetical protein
MFAGPDGPVPAASLTPTRSRILDPESRMSAPPYALASVLLLTSTALAAQGAPAARSDPRILALVAQVSEQRLRHIVTSLAAFGTRETLSDTLSPTRGVGAARRWIHDELVASSPRLRVSYDTHVVAPQGRITRQVELRNVMAVLPGRTARRIYVCGHYDSMSLGADGQIRYNARLASDTSRRDTQLGDAYDHEVMAPGANDDGSGTALTMELARVLAASGLEFDATLVFIVWAGEEQGLVGSRAHVARLVENGVPVEAVFNSDIVGNSTGGDGVVDAGSVRVFSVGPEDSMSRGLARFIARAAATYVPGHRVRLMAREDRFLRGSDHSSFTQAGYPAVVFREAREDFARQHSPLDTVDGMDLAYLTRNARVNMAGVATLALAPAAPRVTGSRGQVLLSRAPSGYDATLEWQASAGAVGYRVYWRDTWSNDWQHERSVGDVNRLTLPGTIIDDWVFGVAAVGPDGSESLVSAYVAPVRRTPAVEFAK